MFEIFVVGFHTVDIYLELQPGNIGGRAKLCKFKNQDGKV